MPGLKDSLNDPNLHRDRRYGYELDLTGNPPISVPLQRHSKGFTQPDLPVENPYEDGAYLARSQPYKNEEFESSDPLIQKLNENPGPGEQPLDLTNNDPIEVGLQGNVLEGSDQHGKTGFLQPNLPSSGNRYLDDMDRFRAAYKALEAGNVKEKKIFKNDINPI